MNLHTRVAKTLVENLVTKNRKCIVGASLSEPHIDQFAVEFVYIYIYICIIRRAVSHFWLLFCEFLHHSLIQKLFTNYSARRHKPPYLLDGNSKDGDPGPTYSMTRAIGATPWRKAFICRCNWLHCHYSPLTVEVTRHMDRPLQ